MESITPAELRRLIRFENGKYYWRVRSPEYFSTQIDANAWNAKHAGKETLISKHIAGYSCSRILGNVYLAHRVIWAFHNGEWPCGQIDHINHVRTDNRIENLRVVSDAENARNKTVSSRNTSGVTGICWINSRNRWEAVIQRNKQRFRLGYYADKSQAIEARKAAEKSLGFHENHGIVTAELQAYVASKKVA